jgi:5-(aminomethyl)-3-furanmethanol phosphate kinase
MTRRALAIVKVGGSLFDWPAFPGRLRDYLEMRQESEGTEHTILIAGGGPAADWIRSLDQIHGLGDVTADRLALHALDLTAAFLAEVVPGSIIVDRLEMLEAVCNSQSNMVLTPRLALAEIERCGANPHRASWDVTSDAIAARIAAHLAARSLVLLKSASLPEGATRQDAATLGLVDPMLPSAAYSVSQVEYVNLRAHPLERRLLPRS